MNLIVVSGAWLLIHAETAAEIYRNVLQYIYTPL